MGPGDNARGRLTELRNALLALHKTLLDSEAAHYDREVARLTSRHQLLGLVLHDPWFAWLHELSELVVFIDEMLEAKEPPTSADADRLIAQARELLSPAEHGRGFSRHYYQALQRDPAVVVAHGAAVTVLR
ncbi:MAG TPA: hypothetical protein PLK67_03620, partial [Bryobacteraceae bacterium]|nr:hypothetical protein [Bryobacteraceae bacterium]